MKYSKRLAHRVIEDQAFILEPTEKVLHSLNPTATVLWRLVGKGADQEAMARALCEEFEVEPAQAKADTAEFLRGLKTMKLVEE